MKCSNKGIGDYSPIPLKKKGERSVMLFKVFRVLFTTMGLVIISIAFILLLCMVASTKEITIQWCVDNLNYEMFIFTIIILGTISLIIGTLFKR
jgi:magnesium-transporting ATPase (P-type)